MYLHLHNQKNHVSSHFIRSTFCQRGVHGRGVRGYVWRNRFRRIHQSPEEQVRRKLQDGDHSDHRPFARLDAFHRPNTATRQQLVLPPRMRIMEHQTHRAGERHHGKSKNRLKNGQGRRTPPFF